MRNISQDMIEVISFYRAFVLKMKRRGYDFDVGNIIKHNHLSDAINDECEYLKILLERED